MLLEDTAENDDDSRVVDLILTQAPLLSGSLRDCVAPNNNNNLCRTGGLAAVQAYIRLLAATSDSRRRRLVIPLADFKSPLTVLSRFQLGVNLLLFWELNWRKTYTVPAYTLQEGRLEAAALWDLQEPFLIKPLVSNVVAAPSEASFAYLEHVHFDDETRLATIYLTKDYVANATPQVETTKTLLRYIYKRNKSHGCPSPTTLPPTGLASFQEVLFSQWWEEAQTSNNALSDPPNPPPTGVCYLPIVIFDDKDATQYELFLEYLRQAAIQQQEQIILSDGSLQNVPPPWEQPLLPYLVVDLYGHLVPNNEKDYFVAQLSSILSTDSTNNNNNNSNMVVDPWLVSYSASPSLYHQVSLYLSQNQTNIQDIAVTIRDLEDLPESVQNSPEYQQDLNRIHQYAHEAVYSMQQNEVGAVTAFMPSTESLNGVVPYRTCYVGECEMGNLWADALRYWTIQQEPARRALLSSSLPVVAVVPSFMFRGPGWQEGHIRSLELLENLPYTAQRCQATMTGHSLWRLLQHSLWTASFGPTDGVQQGGRLVQVSGMQVSYRESDKELLSVNIWQDGALVPLERLRLYVVASCTHFCFTFSDFPDFMGEAWLVEEGEIPAAKTSDLDTKHEVQQYLLENFPSPNVYVPAMEGRLVADRSSDTLPNPRQRERSDCQKGVTFWDTRLLDCVACPSFDQVTFSDAGAKLAGTIGGKDSGSLLTHLLELTNGESYAVKVIPEVLSLPSHIALSLADEGQIVSHLTSSTSWDERDARTSLATNSTFILRPGESLALEVAFDTSERDIGVDTSSLVFALFDVDHSPAGICNDQYSASALYYEVEARLSLSNDTNRLGNVAIFGYVSAAIIVVASLAFTAWVARCRKRPIVAAMQPFFLMKLCVGIFLIGCSLIPLSLDDGVVSQRGCDIACMAFPWLLTIGLTVSATALSSKLWRINKLFGDSQQFRRVKVRERDVMWPTVIGILLNVAFLITWTVADPLVWRRAKVPSEPWNTYGKCAFESDSDKVGLAMMICIIVLFSVMFCLALIQAFRARNISSEFSESKYLGIAIFSWLQLLVVGFPVMFLVEQHNVVARYALFVGLLFAISMSMLLVVFVPMVLLNRGKESSSSGRLRNGAPFDRRQAQRALQGRQPSSNPNIFHGQAVVEDGDWSGEGATASGAMNSGSLAREGAGSHERPSSTTDDDGGSSRLSLIRQSLRLPNFRLSGFSAASSAEDKQQPQRSSTASVQAHLALSSDNKSANCHAGDERPSSEHASSSESSTLKSSAEIQLASAEENGSTVTPNNDDVSSEHSIHFEAASVSGESCDSGIEYNC